VYYGIKFNRRSRLDEERRKWQEAEENCIMELLNVYTSQDIIRVIKSRWVRCMGRIERMGDRKNVHKIVVGKPERKNHLEDTGADWRINSE
jgi:hypothetical protein